MKVEAREFANVVVARLRGRHGEKIKGSPINKCIAYIAEYDINDENKEPYTELFIWVGNLTGRKEKRKVVSSLEHLLSKAGYRIKSLEFEEKATGMIPMADSSEKQEEKKEGLAQADASGK